MKTILIVDDEAEIRDLISYNLSENEFNTLEASNGTEALEKVAQNDIDLILLDVMMPGMDGIEVCEKIRKDPSNLNVTICFLTARGEDYSQIAGLDAGADDYISKPVKPRVLLSRINALLRRSKTNESKNNNLDGLVIDREKYTVSLHGDIVHLPRKEFELLALLASKPGNVFERSVILNTVWGEDVIVGDRTIDVHIRKLREKIGNDLIKTIKGVGYRLKLND